MAYVDARLVKIESDIFLYIKAFSLWPTENMVYYEGLRYGLNCDHSDSHQGSGQYLYLTTTHTSGIVYGVYNKDALLWMGIIKELNNTYKE